MPKIHLNESLVVLLSQFAQPIHVTKCKISPPSSKPVLQRANNRPGMAGTVPELTSAVSCPGMTHVYPGLSLLSRCFKIEIRVSMSASYKQEKSYNLLDKSVFRL